MNRRGEAGYALLEVLAAGVIAALVLGAGMSGLALSVRAAARAEAVQQSTLEARNIAARLRAGIAAQAVAEAYPEWSITVLPYDRPVDPVSGAVLTRALLEHPDLGGQPLQLVFLEAGPERAEAQP